MPSPRTQIPSNFGRCVDGTSRRCCETAEQAIDIMRAARIAVVDEFSATGLPVPAATGGQEFVAAVRYRWAGETRAGIVLFQREEGSMHHPIAGMMFSGPSQLHPSAQDDSAYLVTFRDVDARHQTVGSGYEIKTLSEPTASTRVVDPEYSLPSRLRDSFSGFSFRP